MANLPDSYSATKSNGRVGYEWRCPKGFVYYNFWTLKEAEDDARLHHNQQLSNLK